MQLEQRCGGKAHSNSEFNSVYKAAKAIDDDQFPYTYWCSKSLSSGSVVWWWFNFSDLKAISWVNLRFLDSRYYYYPSKISIAGLKAQDCNGTSVPYVSGFLATQENIGARTVVDIKSVGLFICYAIKFVIRRKYIGIGNLEFYEG